MTQLGEKDKDSESTSQDGLSILEDYFRSQKSQEGAEGDAPFLPDLMQTWSFAFQSDDGALLSAIPKVLVLIFKRISGLIQLREYGLQLCRAVLLPAPLKALARGMSAIPTKRDLICSCLQLLIEVVCFDGGTYAKRVYSNRELAFRSLVRNLGLRAPADQQHASGVPSVRSVAVRYILANLRFQGAANKSDLLQYRSIISPFLKDIKDDPPSLILEILDTFKQHVIQDEVLSRKTKNMFFSEWILGRFATLYSHGIVSVTANDEVTVRSQAHELLLFVCTTPVVGLVPSKPGHYTLVEDPAQNRQLTPKVKDMIDIGPQLLNYDDWRGLIFRNLRLEEFTLHLRPYSDTLQCELLLKIFQAVPDLVPEYFFKKQTFTFDPKLSATWVGYCAFLVSAIRLPVPNLGRGQENLFKLPPPVAVLIESILPAPLTQKVLTRCLNQKSSFVAFFTVRLLIAAFRKLHLVLKALRSSKPATEYREETATQLVNEFCRRCPKMKDVITLFRATSENQVLQREAVTRLLALYYTTIPELAAEETIDLAVPLAKLIRRVSSAKDDSDAAMRALELEHLLVVGLHSSKMRWTHKPGNSPDQSMCSLH